MSGRPIFRANLSQFLTRQENPSRRPTAITSTVSLAACRGFIATPSGDIWALDTIKSQLVHFPKGDPAKGELLCQSKSRDPFDNPCKLFAPFALAIDQQNRIWVSSVFGDHVTRFPASDPTKAETFKAGFAGSGLAVDSLGNVWVTNKLGSSEHGRLKQLEIAAAMKINFDNDPDALNRAGKVLVPALAAQTSGWEGGSVTVFRPDGTEASFSPVYGKGITAPWAVSVDGNDNIWISNLSSASAGVVELCGFRPENCPPDMKTGDAISPPGGYVGGGMQMLVDVGFGPAGDVWVTNKWRAPYRPSNPGFRRAVGVGRAVRRLALQTRVEMDHAGRREPSARRLRPSAGDRRHGLHHLQGHLPSDRGRYDWAFADPASSGRRWRR